MSTRASGTRARPRRPSRVATLLGDPVRRRRVLLLSVGVVVALVLVVLAWQSTRAAISLSRASTQSAVLQQQVATGDVDGARRTLADLRSSTDVARGSTDGPLWALATLVPLLGDDVDAVRTVAREIDVVADEALPPVVRVADQVRLDVFSPREGRIDLEAVERARPTVARADAVLSGSAAAVFAIELDGLFGRLRSPVQQLQERLGSAARASAAAEHASRLLPSMLGGEGERRYLLLVQNNAEVRSGGGIPGSIAVIEADDGELSMGRQGSGVDVPPLDEPILPLTEGETTVFSPSLGEDLRDTTGTPDFPRAARLAGTLVADAFDTSFDGVVSVDPVTLGYLLDGLGPVTLEDDTVLTSDNAVDELLNGVYLRYDDDAVAQDDVFADAARRIFDTFVEGGGQVQVVLDGLVRAASDNRIMVWSTDEAEQAALADTGISGALPGGGRSPHVGVYLNDAAGGKMQYYLDAGSTLRADRCLDGDAQRLRLRTRLTSATPDGAPDLPLSIIGTSGTVEEGFQRVNVRVYAPEGGRIDELRVDGEDTLVVGGVHEGRRVAVVPVTLAPGQSVDVAATMTSARSQAGDPVLSTTPGIEAAQGDLPVPSAC